MKKMEFHGQTAGGKWTPTYNSWKHMIRRCHSKKNKNYADYGGRGIKVCKRWRNSFAEFLKDMGKKPLGRFLNRKNNNGNYSKANCEWATWDKQSNNKRNTVLITFKGKTQSASQWTRELGYSRYLIRGRLAMGWSKREAVSTKKGERTRWIQP